jgi:PAS domain S-box-containing protein
MGKTLRVLNVEDSVQDVTLLAWHLEQAGYDLVLDRVETTESMKAALESREWDIILCDYSMPHFNALSALALLKETGLDIPFIIISGTVGEAVAVEAMRAGAHDYLMKDNLLRLVPTIERELQEAENHRARRQAEEEKERLIAQIETQQQRMNNIVASVPGVVWEAWGEPDAATQRTDFVSDYVETMLGYSVAEWLSTPNFWLSLVHPDDRERTAQAAAADFVSGNSSSTLEFRWVAKDGSVIWVQSISAVITDDEGRPMGLRGVTIDITNRKRAEEALRESEARKRAILESALDCIITMDHAGLVVDWNPAAERTFGYRREDVLGKEMADLIIPSKFREGHRRGLAHYLATGDGPALGNRLELSAVRLDGSEFPIELAITRIESEGLPMFTGYIRDITERKQAEEQLRRQLDFTEAITTSLGEGLYALDRTGSVMFMNPAAELALGWKEAELVGQNMHAAIHFQKADGTLNPATECPLLGVLKSGHTVKIESDTFTRKDGGVFPVSYTASPIITEGEVVGAVLAFHDIAERQRAEEALRESEERYRDLVENAHDIIYEHELEGNYTSTNKAGEQITGYSSEETLKLNLAQTVAPEYLEKAQQMFRRKLAGEKITAYELEIITKRGKQVAVEVNTRLVYQNGVPMGVQGIARDVTERKQLEEQLRRSQKLEAVGQLAGGVAHDFNNLLTVINGYSDLLLRKLGEGDAMRLNVEEIKKAGERAAALTRQLLAFSRKQVLQPKVLKLNAVVADIEKMLRRLIGEDIDLLTVLEPSLGQIKADPGQIEQVILNLAVNARDAMPQGGKITIETRNVHLDNEYARKHTLIRGGHYVMLVISDTGTGMDSDTQARIFEPFFTTKSQGKGTGLGLSTVYGIVKQSEGNIWVYSEIGKGTSFKVYLPRVDEVVQSDAAPESLAGLPQGQETVLLTEDEEPVRRLIRTILEMNGYQVLEATNGDEALSTYSEHKGRLDLIVTDVVMPNMSGPELARTLELLSPGIKVLYLSGYTDDAIVRHGLLDQKMAFLQKPFTPDALLRKVREVLDRKNGA